MRWQFIVDDVEAIVAVRRSERLDDERTVEQGGATHRAEVVTVSSPSGTAIWFEGPNTVAVRA